VGTIGVEAGIQRHPINDQVQEHQPEEEEDAGIDRLRRGKPSVLILYT
jgi:hypothetical protein